MPPAFQRQDWQVTSVRIGLGPAMRAFREDVLISEWDLREDGSGQELEAAGHCQEMCSSGGRECGREAGLGL